MKNIALDIAIGITGAALFNIGVFWERHQWKKLSADYMKKIGQTVRRAHTDAYGPYSFTVLWITAVWFAFIIGIVLGRMI